VVFFDTADSQQNPFAAVPAIIMGFGSIAVAVSAIPAGAIMLLIALGVYLFKKT
jgi:hypothetical protein